MRVFLDPNDCILSCPLTFGMYSFDAEPNAASCIEVRAARTFYTRSEGIRKAVETRQPKPFFTHIAQQPGWFFDRYKTMDELLSLQT
ncbi:MAG: hypothetical protein IPL17_20105 [Anaerolineales bacterium]|nr:hypothetical protein [Anaerolineales bacterium]